MLGPGQEIEDDIVAVVVTDLGPVRRGQAPDHGQQGGGTRLSVGPGQGLVTRDRRPERVGPTALGDKPLGGPDDLERALLAFFRGVAPGRDAVAAQDRPDGLRLALAQRRDIEAELKAGSSPGHPGHAVAKALAGERLAIGRRCQGDPRIGMEVIDVGGVDETVHRRIDRWRRPAASVEAVVERGDHLVLALDARIDGDERAKSVEPEDGQIVLGERAKVATRALDPEHLDRPADHRVDGAALGRRVAPGEVGVALIGAQPVRTVEQVADLLAVRRHAVRSTGQAPQPACWPPTRSATIEAA